MTALSYRAWIRNPSGCVEGRSPLAVAGTWPHDAFHSQHAGQAGRSIQLSDRLCLFLGQLSFIVWLLSPWPVMPEKSVTQEKLKMVQAIPKSGRLLTAEPLLLLTNTQPSPSVDRMFSLEGGEYLIHQHRTSNNCLENWISLFSAGQEHQSVVIPSHFSGLKIILLSRDWLPSLLPLLKQDHTSF